MEKELFRCPQPRPSRTPTQRWMSTLLALSTCLTFAFGAAGEEPSAAAVQLVSSQGDHHLAWTDGRKMQLPVGRSAVVSPPRVDGEQWWVTAAERLPEAQQISLIAGRGEQVSRQIVVRDAADKVLFGPKPVVDAAGVQGVLWLEGTEIRQSAVRYARCRDDRCTAAKTLSPPGTGTQTALSVTVLADDSWLAVWTAYDGEDDEVLWSRFRPDATQEGGAWSTPLPIATGNRVPDITPQVLATPGGALVAWSRFDGRDYRVMVSRFDGLRLADEGRPATTTWSEPLQVGGRGTVYPEFLPTATPTLAYRQAVPGGWTLVRLDPLGHPIARAHWTTDEKQAPVVTALDEEAVSLQWLRIDSEKGRSASRTAAVVPWKRLVNTP